MSVLKLHDVYFYNLHKLIRFAMIDKLFEKFPEPHRSLQN